MMRFLGMVVFLILAFIAGYVAIALRGDDSTSAVVKLLGPGQKPSQCVERLRPHFEKMEPAMTTIADAILESEDIVDIGVWFDWPDDQPSFFVNVSGGAAEYELAEDEIELYASQFKSIRPRDYFSPDRFRDVGDYVSAISPLANCGVPLVEWIRITIGLGWSEKVRKLHIAQAGYIYEPEGIAEIDPCPEVIDAPDPVVICQIKLSEKWLWSLEYWDFERSQELLNQEKLNDNVE